KKLLETLTTITPSSPYLGKFQLNYEERYPSIESIAPDMDKDDFINVIYIYNEKQNAKDNPKNGTVVTSIDVQKYYSPLLSSKIPDEIKKLYKIFLEKKARYQKILEQKELIIA